jgi:hypothetical protein
MAQGCLNSTTQGGDFECDMAPQKRLYGQWKMTQGYPASESNSAKVTQTDFRQLIIERGTRMCGVRFVNSVASELTFKATYAVDLKTDDINYSLDEGNSAGGPDGRARFSFGGDCTHPQLNLIYSNGSHETYDLLTSDFNYSKPGICDNQTQETQTSTSGTQQ